MKHAKRRPDDSTARGWPCPATSATSAAPAGPSSGAALAIRGGAAVTPRHAIQEVLSEIRCESADEGRERPQAPSLVHLA
jgi:hypothetical protein